MGDPGNSGATTAIQPLPSDQKLDLTPTSPSTFRSRLPIELCELIIDFVAKEISIYQYPIPRALTSCYLTCRSWVPRSRVHLYFSVELSSRSRFEKFSYSLGTNPCHTSFVKELRISDHGDPGWVSAVPIALGPKLKSLSTLMLADIGTTSLHPSFHQHLSSFSAISELRLGGDYPGTLWPLRLVWAFPNLRKIWQSGVYSHDEAARLDQDVTATLTLARRKIPLALRHLRLYASNFSRALLPALAVSAIPITTLDFSLPSFKIKWTTPELIFQSLSAFLSVCSSLRTLRLNLRRVNGRVTSDYLSFSALYKLRRLILYVGTEYVEDIAPLARLLSSIPARTLEFLQLTLGITHQDILGAPEPWEVLNDSFLRPNLREVKEISISILQGTETHTPEETVLRLLPALKVVNVAKHWSHSRFGEFWEKL